MSAVLCLPACLRVSAAASRGQAPHGNASVVSVVVVQGVVLGVVVVVVVVLLVVLVVLVELVVVVVLWAHPEDPLAFRWDVGVGHRLQPLGPHGFVDSGNGFGAGLGEGRGRGVPRPRVGPAGGGGCLRRMDCGAFGDGDVAEGWDRVLLCCCLRGGGPCWGQGGAGLPWARRLGGWCAPGAVVSLVAVGGASGAAGSVGGAGGVVVGGAVVGVGIPAVVWVRDWASEPAPVEEDLVLEMWGERSQAGGLPGLLPGRLGRLPGGRGSFSRRDRGCRFGLGHGLVDEGGGEG